MVVVCGGFEELLLEQTTPAERSYPEKTAAPPASRLDAKTPYTLDLVLELNGEWHDKQRIAGIPDPNSGGTTVYLSPSVRVGVDRFSGFLSVGVPVVNQHNGIQSKPDYRVLTGIGARLN